jgi:urease accessory protein UreH
LVHLHNVSGGVLAGDRLALEVEVAAGAAAQITTTGATRLYRHRAGAADSEQHAKFLVGDAALLEYLPDSVIPYAGSRHVQRTEIRLGRGSTLFWWEALAPGRLAAGERFAFESLRIQTEVHAGPRPVLREDYLLEARHKDLSAMARMAEYSHAASFCAVQEGRPAAVLARAGGPAERNRSNTNTARSSGLGRKHAGLRWSGSPGTEPERMLHPPDIGRILARCTAGGNRIRCRAAEEDLLSCFEEERCT